MIVGDHNPVHRDPAFAAKTRFKTPIAHGMVSITLLNQLLPSIFNIKSLNVRFMKPIYPEYELTRTQDLKTCYHDAGMFYWGKATAWVSGLRMHSNGYGYVMDGKCIVDIDTTDDWARAERIAQFR